jgi:hypothetical protein
VSPASWSPVGPRAAVDEPREERAREEGGDDRQGRLVSEKREGVRARARAGPAWLCWAERARADGPRASEQVSARTGRASGWAGRGREGKRPVLLNFVFPFF